MDHYLKNALKGFLPDDIELVLLDPQLETADFLVTDIDNDGEVEVIMLLSNDEKNYIAVLKVNNYIWAIDFIQEASDTNEGHARFLSAIEVSKNIIENDKKYVHGNMLFPDKEKLNFIAIVNDEKYEVEADVNDSIFRGGFLETYLGITIPAVCVDYVAAGNLAEDDVVIAEVAGRVRDGIYEDVVKLIGKMSDVLEYYTEMYVIIESNRGEDAIRFDLYGDRVGFKPSLELINFSEEICKDILIKTDPEPENLATKSKDLEPNAILGAYVYSFNAEMLKMLFNSQTFNYSCSGKVTYENNYKVNVKLKTGNSFELDSSNSKYLRQIYQSNGLLIGARFGQVMAVNQIKFIQHWNEVTQDLVVMQPIVGISVNDVLGYIMTVFKLNYQFNGLYIVDQQVTRGKVDLDEGAVNTLNNVPLLENEKNETGKCISNASIPEDAIIIAQKSGNVDAEIEIETVKLVGNIINYKVGEGQIKKYYNSLSLFIEGEENEPITQIQLPILQCVDISLELINISSEHYKDIVLKINKGVEEMEFLIYSFKNGKYSLIFNAKDFNRHFMGLVTYQNFYKIDIALSTGKRFNFNITQTDLDVDVVYHSDGILKRAAYGTVMPVSKIEFIQNWGDFTKKIVTIQPIIGIYSIIVVGYVVTTFRFNSQIKRLQVDNQQVYAEVVSE
ncbi:hypothetical protein [Candidatus Epulonipiscium viviparus]|uniref:hypothetical protein n=1 Tax=Candidatus Epulonipiscium viviparus TaxID=420336 RepID=UPI00016C05D0|nr:hypothetical protein [Candidatus Epulopiscium viviparus]